MHPSLLKCSEWRSFTGCKVMANTVPIECLLLLLSSIKPLCILLLTHTYTLFFIPVHESEDSSLLSEWAFEGSRESWRARQPSCQMQTKSCFWVSIDSLIPALPLWLIQCSGSSLRLRGGYFGCDSEPSAVSWKLVHAGSSSEQWRNNICREINSCSD